MKFGFNCETTKLLDIPEKSDCHYYEGIWLLMCCKKKRLLNLLLRSGLWTAVCFFKNNWKKGVIL